MATVIVSGMVAGTPGQGGATWAVLQYLLGLRRLGHDVHLVEPVAALTERRVEWCAATMHAHGLENRWCLVGADGATAGRSRVQLQALVARADILLNVAGMLADPALLERIPVRVYLDLDPAFVQLWQVEDGVDMRFGAHTHHVTVADAVGRTIPDCGRSWIPTLPPVVLEQWAVAAAPAARELTTVANWRSYGSIHHDGVHYGQKAHAFRRLLDLPTRVPVEVVVALGIHHDEVDDLAALAANRWRILDPDEVVVTPADYRRFVQGSWAELGIAKSGYVVSDSGWFSDRSACYLASGRPVIAQDTGFGRRLPVGDGLFAFDGVEQVIDAVHQLDGDYEHHRRAARGVAEDHLDSDLVLAALLRQVH